MSRTQLHHIAHLNPSLDTLTHTHTMASKLQGLKVLQTPYKTIAHHEIRTDVLVPETPLSGKRPVIVRFHGGGLVSFPLSLSPFQHQTKY